MSEIRTRASTQEYRSGWEQTFGAVPRKTVPAFTPYPSDKPKRLKGSSEPCDMWDGPCCCGAWHYGKDHEEWLRSICECCTQHSHGIVGIECSCPVWCPSA